MDALLDMLRRDDLVALAIFITCWFGYETFVAFRIKRGHGLPAAMQAWRRDWFEASATRENRIIDIQILRSLAGNSAFMASTSIFVVGGLAAVFGASPGVPLPGPAHRAPVLEVLGEAQSVIDRCVDVAGGHGIPDPGQCETGIRIACRKGIFAPDQGLVIHGAEIAGLRFQIEIKLVHRQGAVFDHHMIHRSGFRPLSVIRTKCDEQLVAVAGDADQSGVDGDPAG